MKALEKERRLEIKRRKELEWREKREKYAWKNAVKLMLLEMLLDNVVDQGNRSVEKSCKEVAKEVIETSLGVWTIREGLRMKQKLERVKTAEKKKRALLEEIDRRKRKERAEMLSLVSRLEGWKAGELESNPAKRNKRRKEWYHHEMRDKKQKLDPDEYEADWQLIQEFDFEDKSDKEIEAALNDLGIVDDVKSKQNKQT